MYDDIFLLVQLINAGHFATLAQKIGVAQSTISRKMESLERSLGVKLFNRNTHNLELTKEGQILYQNFNQCEQRLAQLVSPIYQNSQTITGMLKILLPVSFSHYAITPFLADFSRSNPSLRLCLHYDFQSINMSKDDYDIAIIPYVPNQTTQKVKQINRCKFIIVCSSSYIEKYGLLDDINKSHQHLIVGKLDVGYTVVRKLKLFHEQTNEVIEIYNPLHLMVNSFLESKVMLKSGGAIGALPEAFVSKELSSGEFVRILPDYNLGYLEYYILRNIGSEDQRYKIFARFIEECMQRLK